MDSILQRTESSKIEDWVNTGNEEMPDYKSDNDVRAVIQTEQPQTNKWRNLHGSGNLALNGDDYSSS